MGVPSLNDLAVDGTLNTNKQTNKQSNIDKVSAVLQGPLNGFYHQTNSTSANSIMLETASIFKVLVHKEGYKIHFSENSDFQKSIFLKSQLERNYMYESISINENVFIRLRYKGNNKRLGRFDLTLLTS